MSVLESLKRESGTTPGLWTICHVVHVSKGTNSVVDTTHSTLDSTNTKKESLTVLFASRPLALFTARLIVCMYATASAEYSCGASSKKMPCIANPLEFDAHPAYVATSASTSVMFLVAYPVRT